MTADRPPVSPLWPVHPPARTCVGCTTYPVSGYSSKPPDPDGLMRWCIGARYAASKQEVVGRSDELQSQRESTGLLDSLASYRAWPPKSGSRPGKTFRRSKAGRAAFIANKKDLKKRKDRT